MRRVLVTGATGFLGGHVCTTLLAEGAEVVAIGRHPQRSDRLMRQGVTVLRHDLSEPVPERLINQLAGVDAVVHAAAHSAPYGPPALFERVNVAGTAHMVALARRLGVRRFVKISSPAVYFRFTDQFGLSETATLPTPVNAYAHTKRLAELTALGEPGIGPIVLRPRGLYGRGDTSLLPRLVSAAGRGALPLMRGGRAKTDITHIDDVVSAVLAALRATELADGQVINISGGQGIAIRTIVDTVCRRMDLTPRWRPLPFRLVLATATVMEMLARLRAGAPEPRLTRYSTGLFAYSQTLALDRAATLMNWRPAVSFEEGLARTFDQTGAA